MRKVAEDEKLLVVELSKGTPADGGVCAKDFKQEQDPFQAAKQGQVAWSQNEGKEGTKWNWEAKGLDPKSMKDYRLERDVITSVLKILSLFYGGNGLRKEPVWMLEK